MIRRFVIAFLVSLALPLVAIAQSQATPPEHQHGTMQSQPASADQRQQMMQMHQKMMAEMAAEDQKLDGLASQMNAAQGPAKVDAMAAILTELINDRKQMREHMTSMMGRGGMMGGMMGGQAPEGMTMGTSGGMAPSPTTATFDPVCQARIAANTAPTATYQGRTYQFCSQADKQAFLKDPSKYLAGAK